MLKSVNNRKIISGISLSPGIAIAKVVMMETHASLDLIENHRISVTDYNDEIRKFEESRLQCLEEIETLILNSSDESDISDILQFQKVLLKDSGIISSIKKRAETEKVNIEFIIVSELKKIKNRFEEADSELIKSRFHDIQDVYYHLLCNILGTDKFSESTIKDIDYPFILVAKQIYPSLIASLNRKYLEGIVMEQGSITSHVAIMSKTLDIPAITGVFEISSKLNHGVELILDGIRGIVILNPTSDECEKYLEIKKNHDVEIIEEVKKIDEIKHICSEKIPFSIETNASSLKDAKQGFLKGARGIGLFRSEFFYISSAEMPDSEEEFELYKNLVELNPEKPVTIRLLDVGGDKLPLYMPLPADPVPQLGYRGIRYLLKYPDLLKRQLKNIIRASLYGRVKILIPFVTFLEDLDRTLVYIEEILEEYDVDRSNISIGIMVEIPSVALGIESYLDRIDFISIGTNDLSQYLFAVSREASQLNGYHCIIHPELLKLISSVINSANNYGKEVTICGEIAADPFIASLLVGIGARKLSMNSGSIEAVRKKLCSSSIDYFENMANEAVSGTKFIDILHLISRN